MGERSGAPRASALHQSSFRNLRLRFNYRSQMSQLTVTHPRSAPNGSIARGRGWIDGPARSALGAFASSRRQGHSLRDTEHCKYVATQACVIRGRAPSEAHHIRFAQPRALSRKVSDEYAVPVCRLHHRELHRYGDETSWWAGVGFDPLPLRLKSGGDRDQAMADWRARMRGHHPRQFQTSTRDRRWC